MGASSTIPAASRSWRSAISSSSRSSPARSTARQACRSGRRELVPPGTDDPIGAMHRDIAPIRPLDRQRADRRGSRRRVIALHDALRTQTSPSRGASGAPDRSTALWRECRPRRQGARARRSCDRRLLRRLRRDRGTAGHVSPSPRTARRGARGRAATRSRPRVPTSSTATAKSSPPT